MDMTSLWLCSQNRR